MNRNTDTCNRNMLRRNAENCGCNDNDMGEAAAILADAREECPDTQRRRACDFSQPVCINTNQIYDSCRDRDCVTNQRVYLTEDAQALAEQAINVKLKSAEVIWVFTDVEPLSFSKGYFTVDLKFFVRVTLELFTCVGNPCIVRGLTTYDKRLALFGSEGNTKVFNSDTDFDSDDICTCWEKKNMPKVTVEVADPVALTAAFDDDDCCCSCCDDCDCCRCESGCPIPTNMCNIFDDELVVSDDVRKVMVTYGLFFIVRLERETQLLIDAVDFCIPTHECPAATENNPCALFNDIRFPIDEFFPPQRSGDGMGGSSCGCGCNDNSNGCCK